MSEADETWEAMRRLTLGELITRLKLSEGSTLFVDGSTSPEGFRFHFALVVGKPGAELALEAVDSLREDFMESAPLVGEVRT